MNAYNVMTLYYYIMKTRSRRSIDREKWRLEVNSLKLAKLGSIANPETAVSVFTTSSALRRSARVAARGTENP